MAMGTLVAIPAIAIMTSHYKEFRCAKCGDLFYAEWKRLCTLCDDHVAERQAAIDQLYQMDEETAKRVDRELREAIEHESDPAWKRGKRSMWEGHKE